jgi:hypothetical protein
MGCVLTVPLGSDATNAAAVAEIGAEVVGPRKERSANPVPTICHFII